MPRLKVETTFSFEEDEIGQLKKVTVEARLAGKSEPDYFKEYDLDDGLDHTKAWEIINDLAGVLPPTEAK